MLTVARVVSLALLALSFVTLAHATPTAASRWTNAERFARGLGPAPPKKFYKGTRTNIAARAAPSGGAGTVQSGLMGVYSVSATVTPQKRDSSTFLGYMGPYGLTQTTGTGSASDAWTYTYTTPDPATSVVELAHPGTPYVLSGVAIRSGAQVTLGPGNAYYLEAQNSRVHTVAGSASSTYVYDTYAIGYAQTTIWSVDPDTGKTTPKWVNPDGSIAEAYIAVSGNGIYITGDLSALASQLGTTPTQVELYFQ